jgi:hypothetical protein
MSQFKFQIGDAFLDTSPSYHKPDAFIIINNRNTYGYDIKFISDNFISYISESTLLYKIEIGDHTKL